MREIPEQREYVEHHAEPLTVAQIRRALICAPGKSVPRIATVDEHGRPGAEFVIVAVESDTVDVRSAGGRRTEIAVTVTAVPPPGLYAAPGR